MTPAPIIIDEDLDINRKPDDPSPIRWNRRQRRAAASIMRKAQTKKLGRKRP
jgi:hypothetical protein